jgi:hypothetical protein
MRFLIVTLVLFFSVAAVGKFQHYQKAYTLSLSYNEWVKMSNGLQYTIERIRQSDLPARDVSLITDSVLVPLITHIGTQIPPQLEADKKAADSANKKQQTPKKN